MNLSIFQSAEHFITKSRSHRGCRTKKHRGSVATPGFAVTEDYSSYVSRVWSLH